MTTNSYPAAGTNGLTEAQWPAAAAIGDGVVEDFGVGTSEAFGITLNNTTNEATISAGKARVGGYIGETESATVVSVPAVGSTTVYTIAWCYDPSLNVADGGGARSALGPVRLGVYTGTLDTTGGKRYTPLYVITRTASQVLTASARVDHRRWVGPLLTMPVKPTTDPAGVLFPRGTRLLETSTGNEFVRLPNGLATALEWVNITAPASIPFPAVTGLVAASPSPAIMERFAGRMVQLSGSLRRSTSTNLMTGANWAIGTLPFGWRPGSTKAFTVWAAGTVDAAKVVIGSDGQVFLYDLVGTPTVTAIYLDNIIFRAAGV